MASSPVSAEIVTFAEFEADLRSRELRKNGAKVRVPDQSFQVLAMLLECPGHLVSREEMQKKLWPGDTFVDFDHGLNNAVNRLREALGDSAEIPRFIETLPRRGYRFIATTSGAGSAKTSIISESELSKYGIDAAPARGSDSISYRWLLGTVLAMTVATLLMVWKPQKAPILPSSRTFVLPPDGATFNLIGDSGGSVALSADGTKLAFVAVDSKGAAQIWVRPLGKLNADRVDGTDGATFPFWSPDGKSLGFFSEGKLKKVSLAGGPPVTLCDAPFGRGGSWNSRGIIIFAPESHSGIYRVPDSGGTPIPITTVNSSIHTTHRWPKFLPDGNHFTYLGASHFNPSEQNGVFLSSLDRKENKLVVSTDADATYASGYLFFLRQDVLMAQRFDSEGGRLLDEPKPTLERVLYDPQIWKAVFDISKNNVMAYQLGTKVSGTQLRWFDRSGKQVSVLGDPAQQWDMHLSRDGRRLASGISSTGFGYANLWVYDVARGVRMQVTFGKYDNGSPVWSLDNTRILFAAKRNHYCLYEVDSGGVKPERLILDTGSDTWPLDVSPDGKYLLYGQGLDIGRARSQLWVYALGATHSRFRLLEGDAVEANGQFSPNGRWVAYASNESGRDEIYVVPFREPASSKEPGTAAANGRWQISRSGGHEPRWRRDGKELFYIGADDTLVSVPIASGGLKLEVGTPHPLFRANPFVSNFNVHYDILPDGRRFIINTAAEENAAPITLVENWLSDFRN